MDGARPRLISDLRVLVDEKAPEAAHSFDVDSAGTVDEAQWLLQEYFGGSDAPEAANVMVGTTRVGTATRQTIEQSGRTAAEPGSASEVGVGERIQLPGISTRYRLLKFSCPTCAVAAYRIHYDEENMLTCAKDGRAMELQRED
jgi:hypothetical protein